MVIPPPTYPVISDILVSALIIEATKSKGSPAATDTASAGLIPLAVVPTAIIPVKVGVKSIYAPVGAKILGLGLASPAV